MPNARGAFAKIKKLFEETYLMNDPYVIKILYAQYVTFLLKTDPVWIILTGPPGGLKSELINTFSTSKYVHTLSTLTINTFVSGAKLSGGKPASMLMQLSSKEGETDRQLSGIIAFKDFTSLMSEQEANRSLIFGQLREIYDGKYDKKFGTGFAVNWEGLVTILAGSTHSIHDMKQRYSAMGERFTFYDLTQPDRKEATYKSIANQENGNMTSKRDLLKETNRIYLNETIEIPLELPKISKELKKDLIDLAEMITRARSDVRRDIFSPQKEILGKPIPEMPTRFATGVINLAKGLMVINWNETGEMALLEEDKKALYKINLDSINPSRRGAMQELAKYNVLETKGLAVKLDLPSVSLRRQMEELTALGIAKREPGSGSQGDRWMIKDNYKVLMQKFEGITNEAEELTENKIIDKEALLNEAEEIRKDQEQEETETEQEPIF